MKRLLIYIFMFIALIVHAEDIGVIVKVKGDVYTQIDTLRHLLNPSDIIQNNTTIYSGKDSYALFVYKDKNSSIRIYPHSQLTVSALNQDSKAVNLKKGSISNIIQKKLTGSYTVETNNTVASVRGTIFEVDVVENGTQVHVDRGLVNVQNKITNANLMLSKGQYVLSDNQGTISLLDGSPLDTNKDTLNFFEEGNSISPADSLENKADKLEQVEEVEQADSLLNDSSKPEEILEEEANIDDTDEVLIDKPEDSETYQANDDIETSTNQASEVEISDEINQVETVTTNSTNQEDLIVMEDTDSDNIIEEEIIEEEIVPEPKHESKEDNKIDNQRKPVAVVVKVKGNVDIIYNSKITSAKAGSMIYNNSELISGKDGLALIAFVDNGSKIRLLNNSEIIVNTDQENKTMNKDIKLKSGSVLSQVNKKILGKYSVSTNSTIASVRGTHFLTELRKNGDTAVYGFSGKVEVKNIISGEITLVTAGITAISSLNGSLLRQETVDVPDEALEFIQETENTDEVKIEFEDKDGNIKSIILEF